MLSYAHIFSCPEATRYPGGSMPKEHTDHLHRLIRSMSRAERRYFKLFAERHMVGGQSLHSALFDVIAAQPVYDEQAIRSRFKGAAFLRRYTVTKHRLYDNVLASLEAFHANGSMEARMRRYLHRIELLHQRGLHADADRLLGTLRTMAEASGRASIMLEVLDHERRAMERAHYEGVEAPAVDRWRTAVAAVHAACEQENDLWALKSRAFMLLYQQGKARSEADANALRSLLAQPALADAARPDRPRGRFQWHHVRSALFFALNDLAACEQELAANEALMQHESGCFDDEVHLRLSVMSNLAYVRMRRGRYEEALEGLRRFKQLPAMLPAAPSAELEVKVFAMGASLELAVLSRMGRFDKAVERLPELAARMEELDDRLSPIRKAGLRSQAAWACLGAERPDEALRWCRALLNGRGIEGHVEVYVLARLLNLLLLLETGKSDLLKYDLRNVERYLRTHGRDHAAEQALLTYIRACVKRGQGADRKAAGVLLQELTALEGHPMEEAAFDHFDPVCYALSRARGIPMAQAARDRATAPLDAEGRHAA